MPARLMAVAAVLKKHGIDVEKPSSGSHYKAVRGSVVYPLPAHNGAKSELDDRYLKALCRAFGLDYRAFKEAL